MNLSAFFRSLGPRFLQRSKTEAEIAEELAAHIQLRADDLERLGLTRREAERQARIEFGSTETFREECRDTFAGNFIDVLFQDLRFSFRMIRKEPAFTTIVILTMAVGIGATTAIFMLADATLLRALPYPHPEQLVRVEDDLLGIGAHDIGMSEPEWQDLQHSGIFDFTSPAWFDDNNLTGGSRPARVSLLIVAPDYFSLLGVEPQKGRTFPPLDHTPGFPGEVVISDSLWKNLFAGDPNVLGKTLRLDTDLYHIVGVMPPGFRDPATTAREKNIEVWAETSFYGAPLLDHPSRAGRNLPTAVARIKKGLPLAAAQKRIDALVESLKRQYPSDYPAANNWQIRLVPLKESVVGSVRQPMIFLLLATSFVLIIGCVNVANLLLARASARGREMAIRRALGAARGRLARQLLTESVLLSLFGGVGGLITLYLASGFLFRLIPTSLPRLNDMPGSATVLLFAVAISILCGVGFGLAPALSAGGADLNNALKREGRGTFGSVKHTRTRAWLVLTQFALSLVLLICAGLLLHSFWDLLNTRLGFDPHRVTTIKVRLPYPNDIKNDIYVDATQQAPFFRSVLARCRALPGVEEAALGDLGALPLGHDRNNQNPPIQITFEAGPGETQRVQLIDEAVVMPEYFHLMGMSLLRGRLFNEFDQARTEPVVVINESLARKYWPGQDPLGKHFKIGRRTRPAEWSRIVGIVADARTQSIDVNVPQFFTDIYQRGEKHLAVYLRGDVDPKNITEQVRQQVQAVDPNVPVYAAQALDETVAASLSQRRILMQLVGLFALVALLLAAIGIYGVLSYIVSERTHEIGIRLALGARSHAILGMVLKQGLRLALAGSLIGLLLAIVTSRLLGSVLYGIKPTDPLTFASVPVLLGLVGFLACYFPARRATKVDPIVALHHE